MIFTARKTLKIGLILLVLGLVLTGCDTENLNLNNFYGQVKQLETGEGIGGVEVTLSGDIEKTTTTSNDGTFNFEGIPDATYDISFYKEGEIEEQTTIEITGGEDHSATFKFNSEGNLTGDETQTEGKQFAYDLRDHGINMNNLGQQQYEIMESSSQKLESFAIGVGNRLQDVALSFEMWGMAMEEYEGLPGDYYFEYDSEDNLVLDRDNSNSDDPAEIENDTKWKWNIYLKGKNSTITRKNSTITLTNLYDVLTESNKTGIDYELDLTEGYFKYENTIVPPEGITVDWNLVFELSSTKERTTEWTVNNYDQDETWQVYEPLDPDFNVDGVLDDNLYEYENDEGELIYEDYYTAEGRLEQVDLMLDINFDVTNDKGYFDYTGQIETPVGSQTGSARVEFSEFAALMDDPQLIEQQLPIIDNISLSDEIIIDDYFSMSGGIDIEFVVLEGTAGVDTPSDDYDKMSLPDDFTFTGKYEDLTEQDGFKFNGELYLGLDYSNYDFSRKEESENYIGGQLTMNADLLNTGFNDVSAEFTVNRTGYQTGDMDVDYRYGDNQSITGSGSFDADTVDFSAENERGQTIEYDDSASGDVVGYLYDSQEELLADIVVDDEIFFEFDDGTIIQITNQ